MSLHMGFVQGLLQGYVWLAMRVPPMGLGGFSPGAARIVPVLTAETPKDADRERDGAGQVDNRSP